MSRFSAIFRYLACAALMCVASFSEMRADDPAAEAEASAEQQDAEPEKQLLTGEVVFLEEALAEKDLEMWPETGEHVVLKSEDGRLIPILADWRGRAFYQDEQLRGRKVELIGFFREGLPYLNVLAVYTFDEDGNRQYTDYWCDVCAFPMYQIQPCACCQGDVRLRFQEQDLPDYIMESAQDGSSASDPGQ